MLPVLLSRRLSSHLSHLLPRPSETTSPVYGAEEPWPVGVAGDYGPSAFTGRIARARVMLAVPPDPRPLQSVPFLDEETKTPTGTSEDDSPAKE